MYRTIQNEARVRRKVRRHMNPLLPTKGEVSPCRPGKARPWAPVGADGDVEGVAACQAEIVDRRRAGGEEETEVTEAGHRHIGRDRLQAEDILRMSVIANGMNRGIPISRRNSVR